MKKPEQYWVTTYADGRQTDNWMDWEEDLGLSAEEYLERMDLRDWDDADEVRVDVYEPGREEPDTAWRNLKEEREDGLL